MAGVGVVQLPLLMVRDQLASGSWKSCLMSGSRGGKSFMRCLLRGAVYYLLSERWWIISAKSINGWKRISRALFPAALRLDGLLAGGAACGMGSPGEAFMPTPGKLQGPDAKRARTFVRALISNMAVRGLTRFARPAQPAYCVRGLSNWLRQLSNPVGVLIPNGEYKEKARTFVRALISNMAVRGLTRFARLQPAYCVRGLSNWLRQLSNPGRGSHPLYGEYKRARTFVRALISNMAVRGLTRFARLQPAYCVRGRPTGCASCRTPVGGSHPLYGEYKEKSPYFRTSSHLEYGGEGIRTPIRCRIHTFRRAPSATRTPHHIVFPVVAGNGR